MHDYTVRMFETRRVVAEGNPGGEDVEEDGGVEGVYSFPDRIWNAV